MLQSGEIEYKATSMALRRLARSGANVELAEAELQVNIQ